MMKLQIRVQVVCLAMSLSIGVSSHAQVSPKLTQSLDELFEKHEYDVKTFGPARWLDGGVAFTTLEPSPAYPNSDTKDIVRYETATGARTVLVSASRLLPAPSATPIRIDDYAWSNDNRLLLVYTNSQKVWRKKTRGDYWILDLASGRLRKLGGGVPEATMMFAQFSPDGRCVAYVHANNIYIEDLESGVIRPLTTDGGADLINGTSDWVNEEELDIRNGFRWSPDSKSIAYWQFNTSGVGVYTLINDTAEEHPVLKRYPYPQVGTTNSAVRVGVVNAAGGFTHWMDVPGDSRQHYIARMEWAGNSNELALEVLNRLQNTNTVLLADVHTGVVRSLLEDTDPAWVDVVESFEWLDAGDNLLWLSERDGWRHLYKASRTGGPLKLLTRGSWDVIEEAAVDNKNGWSYYIASPDNPTQRYLYRVRLDGQGFTERVTPANEPGSHSYDISPNGQWAFHTYSTADIPPITELIELPSHRRIRVLESNEILVVKVKPLIPSPTQFFKVTIDGGITLDGWMITPPHFNPAKKYPVLVYVYGEPAGVTVTDKWGGDTTLFHHLIANDGYIILGFDNQGTPAPKGRAWRKVVYGSLGPLSSEQQSAAIRKLAEEHPYIDPSRMAVWGWSGGGSNALNLMFRSPGLFAVGMAVAPMADQRYYDSIYQERYMGLPADNAKGYHDGSPINFADGLKGDLLVVHGSGDDNCHFKVTELLINRLIALGKSFEFMDYPNRTHAVSEGPGTSSHLRNLLARYLEQHLPPGGLSQ
jgi:dipeptidyl-peptidase-4